MALKLQELVVGDFYLVWHKVEESLYYMRYLGEDKWSCGAGKKLYAKSDYDHDYTLTAEFNSNGKVIALYHITVFPEDGHWLLATALTENHYVEQEAYQAATGWLGRNPNNTHWTLASLTSHFENAHLDCRIHWLYEIVLENKAKLLGALNAVFNGEAPVFATVKPRIKKKYKIINCSPERALFKEY